MHWILILVKAMNWSFENFLSEIWPEQSNVGWDKNYKILGTLKCLILWIGSRNVKLHKSNPNGGFLWTEMALGFTLLIGTLLSYVGHYLDGIKHHFCSGSYAISCVERHSYSGSFVWAALGVSWCWAPFYQLLLCLRCVESHSSRGFSVWVALVAI